MGFLRGLGKGIGGIIFSLSLAFLIISIGLVEFTEYENAKAVFSEIIASQVSRPSEQLPESMEDAAEEMTEEELEQAYQTILEMCEGKESIELPISESEESLVVDCNELREGAAQAGNLEEAFGDVATSAFFNELYYREYDCGFIDCIQTGQLGVVISAQGHEFFSSVQIYLMVGVAAGAALILLSAETWSARMKVLGMPLLFTGISYLILTFGKSAVFSKMVSIDQAGAGIDTMSLVDRLVAPMMNSFLIALVAGIALTTSGYILAYKEKGERVKKEREKKKKGEKKGKRK